MNVQILRFAFEVVHVYLHGRSASDTHEVLVALGVSDQALKLMHKQLVIFLAKGQIFPEISLK